MRLPVACLSALFLVASALPARAQVSPTDAAKIGLEIAWQSQVQLPKAGSGVVSSHLWVEPTQPRKFGVVELAGRTIRVSADGLDRRGQLLGIEEAKRQAREQAAQLLGKNDGFEVVEFSVPRIKLVLVTNDGLVQAVDAESGNLLWATSCGPSYAPAHPAVVTPRGVAIIHGKNLYLLSLETGKQLKSFSLRYASSNAIAACNDIVFVADFTGRVEAYGIGDSPLNWSYRIQGRSIGEPVCLADQSFCAFATNQGYVYSFVGGEDPTVWTRYETAAPINGSLAAGNGAFYVGTDAGLLSKIAVAERQGRLFWEFRMGQSIAAPALVVGSQIVVATESGSVFSIDDETGFSQWPVRSLGIAQPLAKAAGKIYCTSASGQIFALNAETGNLEGKTVAANMSKPIVNRINDRLYVLASNGRLQCLRPRGTTLPTMIVPVVSTEQEPAAEMPVEQPAASPATGGDPFNFGGGTAPAAATASSFSTNDPFAGGSAASEDTSGAADPFGGLGGAANPFGDTAPSSADSGAGADPFGAADPFGTPF